MITDYECFHVAIENNVAHIRFVRPDKANSMVKSFWQDLPKIVQTISDEASARVIVLSAEGKHFTSGMDLSVFADPDAGLRMKGDVEQGRIREEFRNHLKSLQNTFTALDKARVPVLAAIQGACIGGGVDLISACDMRYGTEDTYFCIQEINIGMMADVGTFPRLCTLIPQGIVRELAYTGRKLPARRAKDIGLINDLYDNHEEMMDTVMETACEIAARSPLAVTSSKTIINYARDHSVDDVLDYISVWQSGMLSPPDLEVGITASMQKKDGEFQDLQPVRKSI